MDNALQEADIVAAFQAHAATQAGLPTANPEAWHRGMVAIGTNICKQATGGDTHKKTMASAVMTGKVLNLSTQNQCM